MIKEEQQEEEEKLLLRDLEVVFISRVVVLLKPGSIHCFPNLQAGEIEVVL